MAAGIPNFGSKLFGIFCRRINCLQSGHLYANTTCLMQNEGKDCGRCVIEASILQILETAGPLTMLK